MPGKRKDSGNGSMNVQMDVPMKNLTHFAGNGGLSEKCGGGLCSGIRPVGA
jgi:hypothetical protein